MQRSLLYGLSPNANTDLNGSNNNVLCGLTLYLNNHLMRQRKQQEWEEDEREKREEVSVSVTTSCERVL